MKNLMHWRGPPCARTRTIFAVVLAAAVLSGGAAMGGHVPLALDVAALWSPVPGSGYLEFINPTEHPLLIGTPVFTTPPGAIFTEEHTGYTLPGGVGVYELGDGDIVDGDMADFDWVQEHRPDETAGPPISNHPGMVGAMGWTPGTPEVSAHVDPGSGLAHGHSVAETAGPPGPLPVLLLPAYGPDFFSGVDVFSQITSFDLEPTLRDAALDYVLDFGNTITGASTPGIPIMVFAPGWTGVTGIDDWVARWVPSMPGLYNVVAIEPSFEFDNITEIDALAVWIPEPSSAVLAAFGAIGAAFAFRRRMHR